MTGVSRFDCYPSDFLNGLVGLPSDAIAAYTVIMMLQYDRGEPVAYVGREHELSVRTGLPKGRLAKAIDHLTGVGKLKLVDGALENRRTSEELEKINERIQKNGENSQIGGIATKKKWEQIRNENNVSNGPDGKPNGKPTLGPISPPSSLPPSDIIPSPSAKTPSDDGEKKRLFEIVWKKFPKAKSESKPKAEEAFAGLPQQDQVDFAGAISEIATYIAKQKLTNPYNLAAFIVDRRFEGFKPSSPTGAPLFKIEQDSAQGRAWDAYRQATGKPSVWSSGHWYFESEWPSGCGPPKLSIVESSKLVVRDGSAA